MVLFPFPFFTNAFLIFFPFQWWPSSLSYVISRRTDSPQHHPLFVVWLSTPGPSQIPLVLPLFSFLVGWFLDFCVSLFLYVPSHFPTLFFPGGLWASFEFQSSGIIKGLSYLFPFPIFYIFSPSVFMADRVVFECITISSPSHERRNTRQINCGNNCNNINMSGSILYSV